MVCKAGRHSPPNPNTHVAGSQAGTGTELLGQCHLALPAQDQSQGTVEEEEFIC